MMAFFSNQNQLPEKDNQDIKDILECFQEIQKLISPVDTSDNKKSEQNDLHCDKNFDLQADRLLFAKILNDRLKDKCTTSDSGTNNEEVHAMFVDLPVPQSQLNIPLPPFHLLSTNSSSLNSQSNHNKPLSVDCASGGDDIVNLFLSGKGLNEQLLMSVFSALSQINNLSTPQTTQPSTSSSVPPPQPLPQQPPVAQPQQPPVAQPQPPVTQPQPPIAQPQPPLAQPPTFVSCLCNQAAARAPVRKVEPIVSSDVSKGFIPILHLPQNSDSLLDTLLRNNANNNRDDLSSMTSDTCSVVEDNNVKMFSQPVSYAARPKPNLLSEFKVPVVKKNTKACDVKLNDVKVPVPPQSQSRGLGVNNKSHHIAKQKDISSHCQQVHQNKNVIRDLLLFRPSYKNLSCEKNIYTVYHDFSDRKLKFLQHLMTLDLQQLRELCTKAACSLIAHFVSKVDTLKMFLTCRRSILKITICLLKFLFQYVRCKCLQFPRNEHVLLLIHNIQVSILRLECLFVSGKYTDPSIRQIMENTFCDLLTLYGTFASAQNVNEDEKTSFPRLGEKNVYVLKSIVDLLFLAIELEIDISVSNASSRVMC